MYVFAFLGTPLGRWLRATLAAGLAVWALVSLRGWLRVALAAFGLVQIAGSILNICALAPLFGGHLDSRRNLEEYGGA